VSPTSLGDADRLGNIAAIMIAHHGERLFVYGTLMTPAMRRRLLGREVATAAARLDGFERSHERHFFVARRAGAHVGGLILSGLSARELDVLDHYEDVPRLYTRERIEVLDADGARVECWIYLPTGWEARSQRR
jgi:gamma-glutamylcyclotransferase (GGCT)/AIG2-like uncharacterized protein YtfP